MTQNPLKLAYQAHNYIDREAYRRGNKKKRHNPALKAPVLLAMMEQLGDTKLSLPEARRRAHEAIDEPAAAEYLETLTWDELKLFLGSIALFLKSYPKKKGEVGMVGFEDRSQTQLAADALGQQALTLAEHLMQTHRANNLNKLKRMADRVRVTRNKWEALATLAQFYPLKGVPGPVVNTLVEQLSTLHLQSFQDLVARTLLFYEAKSKGWNPNNAQQSESGQTDESGS